MENERLKPSILMEESTLRRLVDELNHSKQVALPDRSDAAAAALVETILRKRHFFGITRLGSITKLDRIGIPVAQVTRPLSLSNSVSQGKGLTIMQAAASALMESVETFAAERIPPASISTMTASMLDDEVNRNFGPMVTGPDVSRWSDTSLQWMTGWNLLTDKRVSVPVSLVDTAYTAPSSHPNLFPRTTTGLGAGRSLFEATIHAGLEIFEREATASARQTVGFFDNCQIDNSCVKGKAAILMQTLKEKGFVVGLWCMQNAGKIPTYWCHLIPPARIDEFAPFPAEGFASDFSDDKAILRALLEAAQSRLAAISGAREDITRNAYPIHADQEALSRWRRDVEHPLRSKVMPAGLKALDSQEPKLRVLLQALVETGARAVILVPLLCDDCDGIYVVRLVAPPLRHGW